MVFLYQQACVRQPPFFGVTDGVEKVTLRPFPVVWPPLKWSTVRGFILTQADKFALRKYLSRLKLVFASDTGSYTLYFLPISLQKSLKAVPSVFLQIWLISLKKTIHLCAIFVIS